MAPYSPDLSRPLSLGVPEGEYPEHSNTTDALKEKGTKKIIRKTLNMWRK